MGIVVALLTLTALLASGSALLLLWGARAVGSSHDLEDRFERIVRGENLRPVAGRRGLRVGLVELGERRMSQKAADREVAMLLAQAGFRGHEALALFTAVHTLLPIVATAASVAACLLFSRSGVGIGMALVGYAAFTVSYLLPKTILRQRAASRTRRLRDDVAAFTHLLRVLYECGLSTEQALLVFAKEQQGVLPDVSTEVGEVTRRVGAGADLGEATRSVAAEIGVPELADLFAMIRQIDRYGGQVQEPLMRFANLLDDRERTRLQESISRLSAKLTMVMVVFLLPALLTFVAGPGFVAVIRALRQMNA